jgi:hypothetical protein
LGDGTFQSKKIPNLIKINEEIVEISAGCNFALALSKNGKKKKKIKKLKKIKKKKGILYSWVLNYNFYNFFLYF